MRNLVILFALLLIPVFLPAGEDLLRIEERKKNGGVEIWAHSLHPCAPYHFKLTFPSLVNFKVDRPVPILEVLKPGESRLITTLKIKNLQRSAGYRLETHMAMGDPSAKHDPKAVYLLPWEHGVKHQVVQGWYGGFTHQGKKAIDFDLDSGSAIHAARSGLVVRVKEDSNTGGPSKKYALHSNVVEIMHADGSWATYAHLKKNGALVKLGQAVQAGEKIGLSGATGQAKGPHLHFSVNIATWNDADTVFTDFLDLEGKAFQLKEGGYYYSIHPGKPGFEVKLASMQNDESFEKHQVRVKPGKNLKIREERLDEKVYLFVANHTEQYQEVEFNFSVRRNVTPSKNLPIKKIIPPRTELYFLNLTIKPGGGATYGPSIRYIPVKSPR